MDSACRFALVASSLGRTLGTEAAANSAGFLLARDGASVAKPLLNAANKPVLTHWLDKVRQCPRLLPIESKVFIVVNNDHLPMYEDWAREADFPCANILPNGSRLSDAHGPGFSADVDLVIQKTHATGWVFAASADLCLLPNFNLQPFLESAFLTGRVTVATAAYSQGLDSSAGAFLALPDYVLAAGSLAQQTGRSFKAASVETTAGAQRAPVFALAAFPASALPAVHDEAAASSGAWQALPRLIARCAGNLPISGYVLAAAFSVRTLSELLFTDRFFAHWDNRCAEADAAAAHKAALEVGARTTVGSELLLGVQPSMYNGQLLTAHHSGGPDVGTELADYAFDEREALVTRSQLEGADVLLPSRFIQSEKWDYSRRRAQHPCFTTANNAYGMRNPLKADMPMTWHGAKGDFTKTFAGPPRDRGLRCWIETSNVHRAFDEF